MRVPFRDIKLAVFAVLAVAAVSVAGQVATFPNLAPWYAGLAKPSFNPPNWIFGPVWTALYVLIAIALWRVLRLPISASRTRVLVLLFAMMALNAAWSWMFFAAHNPFLGLVNIFPQLALIVATIVACRRLDMTAAWCLVPLAAWVTFATVLNLSIWRLNGSF